MSKIDEAKEPFCEKASPKNEEAMATLEKWFSDTHDKMYAQHDHAAKHGEGLFCKIFEAAMGAHDIAWVQWGFYLQSLKIPFSTICQWRKPK